MTSFLNKASKNPSKLLSLKGVGSFLTGNFAVSISCFMIRANREEFTSYSDYGGSVTGVAASLSHVSATYSWGTKSSVVGVGISSTKIVAASYVMNYSFIEEWTKKLRNVSKKIKKRLKRKRGKRRGNI